MSKIDGGLKEKKASKLTYAVIMVFFLSGDFIWCKRLFA